MATGHPDYLTWAGRAGGGTKAFIYTFSGAVAGESTEFFDLPVVAANTWHTYNCIAISCNDDSAIHNVVMERLSDVGIFFEINFINGGLFDFPGFGLAAGETCRVLVTNNSAGALTFEGTIYFTIKPV